MKLFCFFTGKEEFLFGGLPSNVNIATQEYGGFSVTYYFSNQISDLLFSFEEFLFLLLLIVLCTCPLEFFSPLVSNFEFWYLHRNHKFCQHGVNIRFKTLTFPQLTISFY